jgi:hypothetical protein
LKEWNNQPLAAAGVALGGSRSDGKYNVVEPHSTPFNPSTKELHESKLLSDRTFYLKPV